MKAFYKTTGLAVLCELVGKTRQAFYEKKWRNEKIQFEDAIIVDLVKKEKGNSETSRRQKIISNFENGAIEAPDCNRSRQIF